MVHEIREQVLTPALCRGARGLLNWTQNDLADHSQVSRSTIRDYEGGRHDIHRSTAALLVGALEQAGIVFVCNTANGTGLFLSRPVEPSLPDDGTADRD